MCDGFGFSRQSFTVGQMFGLVKCDKLFGTNILKESQDAAKIKSRVRYIHQPDILLGVGFVCFDRSGTFTKRFKDQVFLENVRPYTLKE